MGALAKLIGIGFSVWFVGAWGIMLQVGIAHLHWWPLVPLMGFGTALGLFGPVVLIAIIAGVLKVVFGLDD